MAAMTDFMENKLVDWLFRGQAIGITGASAAAGTGPTTLHIALFTGTAPTDVASSGTEVPSTNSYARVAVTSGMSATGWSGTNSVGSTTASTTGTSGTTSNNGVLTFPTPTTAGWGTVTAMAVFDAATGGNMLIWAPLTTSKVINVGDLVTFPANTLTFQIDN